MIDIESVQHTPQRGPIESPSSGRRRVSGRYGRYIGRVGALAVAIGVGAAVATTPAVAWADGPDGQTQTHKSADTGSKRESKSESKSGSESGSKSGSKSESKSESKSKSESGSESESKSGSESESESSGAKDGGRRIPAAGIPPTSFGEAWNAERAICRARFRVAASCLSRRRLCG